MSVDEFAKRLVSLKMAVNTFVSSYQKETNAIVANISSMASILSELEKIWIAYSMAITNDAIQKSHVKVRARVQMLKNHVNDSIAACGSDQRLLDKYSENQNYVERKVSELYEAIPKEVRTVVEPEQMELDFGFDSKPASPAKPADEATPVEKQDDDGFGNKSEAFIKRINEVRVSINGFVSSYGGKSNNIIGYVQGMELIMKTIDSLWRRYSSATYNEQILNGINDSIRRNLKSLESQCMMSELIGKSTNVEDEYQQNHKYLRKKINELAKSFPDGMRAE